MIQPVKRNSFALFLGLIALILVFFMNLRINLLSTSLIRGILAFIIFYIVGSLIYFAIYTSSPKGKDSINQVNLNSDTNFDLSEIYQTIRTDGEHNQNKDSKVDFQPLELKKIELSD